MLADRPYMRSDPERFQWSATLILVVANFAVYVLQLITALEAGQGRSPFTRYLALLPGDLARGWIWQLLTFQFLHGGTLHLICNCIGLWLFGRPVEAALGRPRFLQLYFLAGVIGGLVQVACSWVFPRYFGVGPVVGASAGIFGIVAAFAAMNKDQPITTYVALILPVTLRAKYLLVALALLGVLGLLERGSGVAHAAHLGGMAFGLAFIRFGLGSNAWWPERLSWRRPGRQREPVRTAGRRMSWSREPGRAPEEVAPGEFISREVDPILDKISAHGIQSLTEQEKKILEAARARMARR